MKRAEQRKFHYIYRINRFDGKYYIGLHSTDNLDDGYFGSGTLLSRSIKKHGREKHTKEILEFCSSRVELKQREKEIVNEDCIADTLCMNLKLGGVGGWDHIDSKAIEKRARTISRVKSGVKHSPTHRLANSKAKLGNTNFETSTRFEGKKCSDEHKRKIAEKNKQMVGERNSQFGTCWVTNGVKPVKIKKEQLNEYLQMGYSRGRKMATVR